MLRLRRLAAVHLALAAAQAALEGGAPGARDRALAALAAAEGTLARERGDLSGAEADEADRLAREVRDARSHLLLSDDPERVFVDLAGTPADGPLAGLEVRLAGALLVRAAQAFDAAARGPDAAALARGDEDLARVASRRLLDRDAGEAAGALVALHEQAAVARLGALVAFDRAGDAAAAVRAYRERFPSGRLAPRVDALERALLAARLHAGTATPEERARLRELLVAWTLRDPDLPAGELRVLGDALVELGAPAAAARCYGRALGRGPDRETAVAAHLGLARLARAAGDLDAAGAQLASIAGPDLLRLDVRLERCLLLRARGEPQAALAEYARLLGALEAGRPPAWWQVAEEAARAYVEAGDVARARTFLEGLRRLDPTFGADAARADRLLALMRDLDARR